MSVMPKTLALALAVACARGFAADEATPPAEVARAMTPEPVDAAGANGEASPASGHVPPAPPQSTMPDMTRRR